MFLLKSFRSNDMRQREISVEAKDLNCDWWHHWTLLCWTKAEAIFMSLFSHKAKTHEHLTELCSLFIIFIANVIACVLIQNKQNQLCVIRCRVMCVPVPLTHSFSTSVLEDPWLRHRDTHDSVENYLFLLLYVHVPLKNAVLSKAENAWARNAELQLQWFYDGQKLPVFVIYISEIIASKGF